MLNDAVDIAKLVMSQKIPSSLFARPRSVLQISILLEIPPPSIVYAWRLHGPRVLVAPGFPLLPRLNVLDQILHQTLLLRQHLQPRPDQRSIIKSRLPSSPLVIVLRLLLFPHLAP